MAAMTGRTIKIASNRMMDRHGLSASLCAGFMGGFGSFGATAPGGNSKDAK
jgi:hypothetical protein